MIAIIRILRIHYAVQPGNSCVCEATWTPRRVKSQGYRKVGEKKTPHINNLSADRATHAEHLHEQINLHSHCNDAIRVIRSPTRGGRDVRLS